MKKYITTAVLLVILYGTAFCAEESPKLYPADFRVEAMVGDVVAFSSGGVTYFAKAGNFVTDKSGKGITGYEKMNLRAVDQATRTVTLKNNGRIFALETGNILGKTSLVSQPSATRPQEKGKVAPSDLRIEAVVGDIVAFSSGGSTYFAKTGSVLRRKNGEKLIGYENLRLEKIDSTIGVITLENNKAVKEFPIKSGRNNAGVSQYYVKPFQAKNEQLKIVIKRIMEDLKLDYTFQDAPDAEVNFTLEKTENLERVLDKLLTNLGYAWTDARDMLVIKKQVKEEEFETKMYYPLAENVESISDSLRAVLTAKGTLKLLVDTKAIYVRDVRSNISVLDSIVDRQNIPQKNPPRCAETQFISKLNASLINRSDVKIDWSKDLPFSGDGKGIGQHMIYRDTKPITDIYKIKQISDAYGKHFWFAEIPGHYTFWIDSSEKEKGVTYYYVVTAVNSSDNVEQTISEDPRYNASVTIP